MKKLLCSLLRCTLVQIHCLFDCIITLIFSFYYRGKDNKVPPVDDDLLLDSAIVLAEKIRYIYIINCYLGQQ